MSVAVASSGHATTELLTRQLDQTSAVFPQLNREGPWLHVCEARADGQHCRYEQTVTSEAGAKVILMLLEPPPGQSLATPVALFNTPLGVLLPAGLALSFDRGSPTRISFRTCNEFGCLAPVALDGTMRSHMMRSNWVVVEFASQAGEPFRVEFSLARSAAILKGK